jgi:hypothetical protein
MQIDIIYFDDCPSWEANETASEVFRIAFVQVNGVDLWTGAKHWSRVYSAARNAGAPTVEMLRESCALCADKQTLLNCNSS